MSKLCTYLNLKQIWVIKPIFQFIFGIILGWLFFEIFLTELEFSPIPSLILGIIISLMLGFGNALSAQIRCISCLVLPSFCTKGGKGIMRSIAVTYVIAGPIQNMIYNGAEVIRTFACVGYLSSNLSRANYELTFKPFKNAILGMKMDSTPVEEGIKSFKGVVNPIRNEIESDDEIKTLKKENDYEDYIFQERKPNSEDIEEKYKTDETSNKTRKVIAKNVEKKYFKKLEYRCQNLISKTEANCRNAFSKAYDNCYDKVTWVVAWALCSPMKVTFVCSMFSVFGGEKICDPSEDVSDGFGEGYNILNQTAYLFRDEFKVAHINYKFVKPNYMKRFKSAKEAVTEMIQTANDKKTVLDFFCRCLKRILAFGFIRLIYIAFTYHDNYLDSIRFDNIFVTSYFRRIENRRRMQGKIGVLPLRGRERIKYVNPYTLSLTHPEKVTMLKQMCTLLFELIFVYSVFMIDVTLFQTMVKIREGAVIEYTQTGHHILEVTVKGTGVVAQVLRSLLKGFNFSKRVNNIASNKHCLPDPRKGDPIYKYKTIMLYSLIFIVTVTQCYMRRLFRVICMCFYRKVEKKRVLYLYNFLLRKRFAFNANVRSEIKRLAENNQLYVNSKFLLKLSHLFPSLFGWLTVFKSARFVCLVCRKVEPRSGFPVSCSNQKCPVVYCNDCWQDVGRNCYACEADRNVNKDDGSVSSDDSVSVSSYQSDENL